MSLYFLQIIKNGQVEKIPLSVDQTLAIQAEAGVKYQVVDSQNNILNTFSGNTSLNWTIPGTENPVLEINQYVPVTSQNSLSSASSSVSASSTTGSVSAASEGVLLSNTVVATEVGILSSVNLPLIASVAGGVVATTAGGYYLSNKGKKSATEHKPSESAQPAELPKPEVTPTTPAVVKPEPTPNPVVDTTQPAEPPKPEVAPTTPAVVKPESTPNPVVDTTQPAEPPKPEVAPTTPAVVKPEPAPNPVVDTTHPAEPPKPEVDPTTPEVVKPEPISNPVVETTPPAEPPKPEVAPTTPVAPSPMPAVKVPSMTLDSVTSDNVVNFEESKSTLLVTGQLMNAPENSRVILVIGGNQFEAQIQGNTFSANVSGEIVAQHRNIVAMLQGRDEFGRAIEHSVEKTYQVDTEIATPVIEFNAITEDNIINRAESNQPIAVSGRVRNVENGKITLQIGEVNYQAVISEGKFTTLVNGRTLAVHQNIRATVNVSDEAGNTATANQEHHYQVMIDSPTPIIQLDDIAGDNIINRQEANAPIRISGVVRNVEEGQSVVVACGCPACANQNPLEKIAIVQGGRFSIEFAGGELVADGRHQISAKVVVRDQAGNEGEAIDVKNYHIDFADPVATIRWNAIAEDNQINAKEANQAILLSGRIEGLKVGETATVMVQIGTQQHQATVIQDQWQLNVTSDQLAAQNSVQAHLTVISATGNEIRKTASQSYRYDTLLNVPQIQIEPLKNGASLNQADSLNTLRVSGRLTLDDDVTAKTVTVMVGNRQYSANVNGLNWSADIRGSELTAKQGENQLTVRVEVQDAVGNRQSAVKSLTYQVDTIAPSATIRLEPIAENNQVTNENREESLTIRGQVEGEFTPNSSLQLSVNGTAFQVNLNANGTFELPVAKSVLIAEGEHQIKATLALMDAAGNPNSIAETLRYEVIAAPEKEPENEPSETETDVVPAETETEPANPTPEPNTNGNTETAPSVPENPPSNRTPVAEKESHLYFDPLNPHSLHQAGYTRLTGQVVLEDKFTYDRNKHKVYGITIKIGDKTYTSAVDKHTQQFSIDIEHSELATLNQQAVSYQIHTADTVFRYNMNYNNETSYAPKLDKVRWNGEHIRDNRLALTPEDNLTLSGYATGKAKEGDRVQLQIGDQQFETTLNGELKFSYSVARTLLQKNAKITATLLSDGNNAAESSVSYSVEPTLNPEYVTVHKHRFYDYENMPYFLNALIGWDTPIYHNQKRPFDSSKTSYLNYRFYQDTSGGYHYPYSPENQEAVREALKVIEKYANIQFNEVFTYEEQDITYRLIRMNGVENGLADYGSWVAINRSRVEYGGTLHNPTNFSTVLHETMHSLGAKHSFEGKIGRDALSYEEDRRSLTVMSYRRDQPADKELHLYDIVFLHYRYGVNPNARAGNDVYRFRPFNRSVTDAEVYIWDGGGIDTFDASDQTQSVYVNLTPGSWIYSGQKTEKFAIDRVNYSTDIDFIKNQAFIGYATQIERLIGSDHNDELIGNNANNSIYGGSGNDIIRGGEGNDYLDGGLGADQLAGELGDDIYVIDNTQDSITELAGQGTDSVHSYIDYTLGEHLENLRLFGTQNLSATGNELANEITGNAGNNRINGKAGSDVLTGGSGEDIFIFDQLNAGEVDTITDFTVGEDKIGLDRTVFTQINQIENVMQYIEYDASTGYLSYQNQGTKQQFAKLQTGLIIDETQFILV